MQQKIVDYTLCQRLAELKFKCESHTGFWYQYTGSYGSCTASQEIKYSKEEPTTHHFTTFKLVFCIKAYDCWDLLMWLRDNYADIPPHQRDLTALHWKNMFVVWDKQLSRTGDSEPQNALAKGIIKILEERQ